MKRYDPGECQWLGSTPEMEEQADGDYMLYTDAQEAIRQAYNDGLEAAASIADSQNCGDNGEWDSAAATIASAIRDLKK